MISNHIGSMRQYIQSSLLFIGGVVIFVIGWTLSQTFERYAFFHLDLEVNLFDLISFLLTALLSVYLVVRIEKKLADKNNDKSFALNELDEIIHCIYDLQRDCQVKSVLSLKETIFKLSRLRKRHIDLWSYLQDVDLTFSKGIEDDSKKISQQIKIVNSYLTDTKNYIDISNPLKISNGKIYITADSHQIINLKIDELRKFIYHYRCLINKW